MRARAHRPRPRAGRPRSSAARRRALRRRRTPDAAACGSRRACARESIRSKRSRVRPGALCFVSFCSCLASGIRHLAFGTRRRMTCDVQRRARSRRALPHARAPDRQASSGRPRMHARRIEAAAGSARHGRTRGAAPPSGARCSARRSSRLAVSTASSAPAGQDGRVIGGAPPIARCRLARSSRGPQTDQSVCYKNAPAPPAKNLDRFRDHRRGLDGRAASRLRASAGRCPRRRAGFRCRTAC